MTNAEANKIVKSYSRTLILVEDLRETLCPRYFPESLLEYPKEKIREALQNALNYAELRHDKDTAELIKEGMLNLSLFIEDEEAYHENHQILGRKEYWVRVRKKINHTN